MRKKRVVIILFLLIGVAQSVFAIKKEVHSDFESHFVITSVSLNYFVGKKELLEYHRYDGRVYIQYKEHTSFGNCMRITYKIDGLSKNERTWYILRCRFALYRQDNKQKYTFYVFDQYDNAIFVLTPDPIDPNGYRLMIENAKLNKDR